MNCIIISTKHGTYQITNASLDSNQFFSGADTSAPQEFLQELFENKGLVGNYLVRKWTGNAWSEQDIPVNTFLSELNTTLEEDIENKIYGYDDKINTVSFTELADHLVGNKQVYGTKYAKNLWFNRGMMNTTMYAFSKNRGVVMTGVRNERAHTFWFDLYEELKAEQTSDTKSKPITNLINELLSGEYDVFEKLTMLVNNRQSILIEKLGNRYIKAVRLTESGSETKKSIREKSNDYIGCTLSIGGEVYIIPENPIKDREDDTITLYNVNTNKFEIIDIKTINSSLYLPINVSVGGVNYYCFKYAWFSKSKNKFKKVESSETLKHILNTLSATDGDVIILSGRPLNISTTFETTNSIYDMSPVGTMIQVGNKWYTKQENGEWANDSNVLVGSASVYAIKFPETKSDSDNQRILLVKQQLLPSQSVFTKDEIYKMLSNAYSDILSIVVNGENIPIIEFNEFQKRTTLLKMDDYHNITMSISINPYTMQKSTYILDIIKACEFLKEYNKKGELYHAVVDRTSKKHKIQDVYKEYYSSKGITKFKEVKSNISWDELSKRESEFLDTLEKSEIRVEEAELQRVIEKMISSGNWSEFCEVKN